MHLAVWQELVSGDTTNVQYGVLAVLAARPGLAQKELCAELDLDRSTIADVCARLEKNGMVTRVAAREDRRRNVLDLTDEGRTELARLRPLVERVQVKLTGNLSDDEHDQLRALLKKMADHKH